MSLNKTFMKLTERLKKDKKLLLITVLGIAGMLLLLFSGGASDKQETKNTDYDIYTVEKNIEDKLEELLENVEGVGKVRVMVTVDSLEERTFAVNTESESGENSYEYSDEYVIIEESGDTNGLTLKITAPVVRGVGITCEGAASNIVKQEIIRLVSAALGVPVNRIWVTIMKE